ncbi:MAG: VCBS repeat-containing protein [Thermoanaerobaculia bacterium]|nr:VCBS repeat-containing protein [Thermoanaerobaculia bacterium]MBP9822646.1 VCBS repeat-containing protein [Thermoanaerobaculia bacterium]
MRRLVLAGFLLLAFPHAVAPLAAQVLTDFHLQWVWSQGGELLGRAGFEVVDLAGDGRSELLTTAVTSSTGYWYTLDREGADLVQTHSSLPSQVRPVQVNVASENGRPRILITGPASIQVLDGPTRDELASFPSLGSLNRAAAAADIDLDGRLDLAVCDDSTLYVYDLLTGNARVRNGFGCKEVALGQTDSDPQLEIILAGSPAGGYVLDGISLSVDWGDVRGFGDHVAVADFDADGQDEVAALAESGTVVRVQDPATGGLLWEVATSPAGALAAANMDGEPGAELVWAIQNGYGSLFVVDGATPTQLGVIPNPAFSVEAVTLGDLDDDGVVDVIWSSGRDSPEGQHVYLQTGDQLEPAAKTADLRGGVPGMAVGDFRGDGTPEVAATSAKSKPEDGGIAFVLALESGRVQRTRSGQAALGPEASGLAAAQLDEDAALEICQFGGVEVVCFDGRTFGGQWAALHFDGITAVGVGTSEGETQADLFLATFGPAVVAVSGSDGSPRWSSPIFDVSGFIINQIDLADVSGDARPEIVAGSMNTGVAGLATLNADTGQVLAGPWHLPLVSTFVVPGSGPPALLLAGLANGDVVPADPISGLLGPPVAAFPAAAHAMGIADFDRDGVADLVATIGNHVQVLDGQTGLPVWVSPYLRLSEFFSVPRLPLLAGDLDRDTVPEILVATLDGIVHFEAPLLLIFANGFESGDTSNW